MDVPPGLESVLSIDPEVMHGDLCFRGTRVPLTVLLDNLAEGMGIDEFLDNYPSVERLQVESIIHWQNDEIRRAAGIDRVYLNVIEEKVRLKAEKTQTTTNAKGWFILDKGSFRRGNL